MSRPRRSRKEDPRDMARAMRAALESLGLTDYARMLEIIAAWREAVGPQIAARSQPHMFSRGVLVVKVASAAWQNELVFLKVDLIKRLNAALRSGLVKDLKVVSGRVYGPEPERRPAWLDTPPHPDDEHFAHAASASVADPELRATLTRLVEKACRLERYAARAQTSRKS